MREEPKSSVLLSLTAVLALLCLILCLSISLPIYIRPFYYAHIEAMNLPEESGFTPEQIREAYDQVLDYLTLPGRSFGTGVMAYSEEGEAHFADCRVLFRLNNHVLLISAGILLLLLVLRRMGKTGPYRLGRRSAMFWAAVLAVVLPVTVGGAAALDFDRAFVIFHSIFFPGKDNWLFNPRTDEIIRVLPQDFFMHCAMLIGAGVLVMAVGLLAADWCLRKRNRKQKCT